MRTSRILGMGLGILVLAACTGQDEATAPAKTQETWCIQQGSYVGKLMITIDGGNIIGGMDWVNYTDASVSGSAANLGKDSTLYDLEFDYTPSLIGVYKGTRRKGSDKMAGRTHAIVDGTPDVEGETGWSATLGTCQF